MYDTAEACFPFFTLLVWFWVSGKYKRFTRFLEGTLLDFCQSSSLMGCDPVGYFEWEDIYEHGEGDPQEYQLLKATHASYMDEYEFLELHDELSKDISIQARVKRVSDGKEFVIPLSDLMPCFQGNEEEQEVNMLSDYVTWFYDYGLYWDEQQQILAG